MSLRLKRKVSQVSRMWVKQALVEQGVYREQENSPLGWPDCTHFYRPPIKNNKKNLSGKSY